MIDTDKYEGHTPAPWRLDDDCDLRVEFTVFHDGASIGTLHTDKPTTELIADAQLLLQALIDERAEVKRLREIIQVQIVTPRSKQFFMQHYGKGDFEEQWKKWADEIQDKVWGRKE